MKKIAAFLVSLGLCSGAAMAQDATGIVKSSQGRIQSSTVSSRSRMVITAKNGSTTERIIDQYSKDGSNGYGRTVIVFQNPATVKGTRFLTMDKASGKKDQWIFLPGLGKIRRIASSESGGSFMGTDFSYDDVSLLDRDVALDVHTLKGEEPLNGQACYVIQPIPKDGDFHYSKISSWIDTSNYRVCLEEVHEG